MSVALSAGAEACLAVPAEVTPACCTLHVHTASVLLDSNTTLGACASFLRLLGNPLCHLGLVIGAETPQLVADEVRVSDGVASRAHSHTALAAVEVVSVGLRCCAPVDHLNSKIECSKSPCR